MEPVSDTHLGVVATVAHVVACRIFLIIFLLYFCVCSHRGTRGGQPDFFNHIFIIFLRL
jgi:hypothetical protein